MTPTPPRIYKLDGVKSSAEMEGGPVWGLRLLAPNVPEEEAAPLIAQNKAFHHALRSGEIIPAEIFGDGVWRWSRPMPRIPKQKPFMDFSGRFVVSGAVKDVLERFDLGNTVFHRLTMHKNPDTTPLWDTPMYLLNVANHKKTVDLRKGVEQGVVSSTEYIRPNDPPSYGNIIGAACPVWRSALDGPDIWMAESFSVGPFFITHRIADALRKEKLIAGLDLTECPFSEGGERLGA